MAEPRDRTPDGKDIAESEAEAANRQNNAAEADMEAGFSPPGGKATQSAGGTGPTGQPHASSDPASGMRSEGEPDSRSLGQGDHGEGGMLGEGV